MNKSYPNKMMTTENKPESCPVCRGPIVRDTDGNWACYKCNIKSFGDKKCQK